MAVDWLDSQVFLVMCTRRKCDAPAPAQDLYTSPFFVSARRVVESTGARWFVLSGRHGLVEPQTVLAPYDLYLADLPAPARQEWARGVGRALRPRLSTGDRITLLAEPVYGEFLVPLLREQGTDVAEPLALVDPEGFGPFLDDAIRQGKAR